MTTAPRITHGRTQLDHCAHSKPPCPACAAYRAKRREYWNAHNPLPYVEDLDGLPYSRGCGVLGGIMSNWSTRTAMSKIHKRDIRERVDTQLRLRAPGQHKFAVFRLGDDVCAKCGKTRKEHRREEA